MRKKNVANGVLGSLNMNVIAVENKVSMRGWRAYDGRISWGKNWDGQGD